MRNYRGDQSRTIRRPESPVFVILRRKKPTSLPPLGRKKIAKSVPNSKTFSSAASDGDVSMFDLANSTSRLKLSRTLTPESVLRRRRNLMWTESEDSDRESTSTASGRAGRDSYDNFPYSDSPETWDSPSWPKRPQKRSLTPPPNLVSYAKVVHEKGESSLKRPPTSEKVFVTSLGHIAPAFEEMQEFENELMKNSSLDITSKYPKIGPIKKSASSTGSDGKLIL